jgi:hypothetical protein
MTAPTATRSRASAEARSDRGALVWIDRCRAIVTQLTPAGDLDMQEFAIDGDDEAIQLAALGAVVHAIRDCQRLTVLGTDGMRTLLEREYVAIVKRPDRIVDAECDGPLSRTDLAARFRGLA